MSLLITEQKLLWFHPLVATDLSMACN